jgi:Ca-activated chloride channel family protein
MSFGHPLLLVALLAIPLAIALYRAAERRRMRYAIRFTNLDVLATVLPRRAWRRYVPPVLFLLALASLCVGLARPRVSTLVAKERATVILVIDVSGSMRSRDVKPTRLVAAQNAVRTFLDHAPRGLRVGLIAFAGEPQVASPPTTDRALLRQSLDDIGTFGAFGGTALGDALAAAVALGRQSVGGTPASGSLASVTTAAPAKGLVSILFLSDGKQTRGMLEPSEGAQRAKDAGIPVYTVALGTPGGTVTGDFQGMERTIPVPPDPATLRQIAQTTGGKFFAAQSAESVRSAYASLGSKLGRTPGRTEVTYAFLAAAAGLLLAAGVLSAAWAARLP